MGALQHQGPEARVVKRSESEAHAGPHGAQPPEAMLTRHDRCPLCSGRAAAHLSGTWDLHYGIDGRWDYQRCGDCGVVFLNPAPTEAFLANAYDDSYYSYQDFAPPKRWHTWLRKLIGYNHGTTGDPKFAAPGRILDIGCGSGAFLYKMKQAGWETHGVELSAKAAEIGNTKHQLNIQAGTLVTATLPSDYFDYIRLNHSFEHILNPHETLALIHRHLSPRGLLFIGVPNVDGLQAKVFGKFWWNLGPPVHPFNYSKRTLTRLLEQHGFEVVHYRTNSNFAGILGSLQMALNGRRGVRSDTGAVFRNPVAKVLSHWLARLSDLFQAGDCLEIIARRRPA
jgi:SAM-dependent methyltransferase